MPVTSTEENKNKNLPSIFFRLQKWVQIFACLDLFIFLSTASFVALPYPVEAIGHDDSAHSKEGDSRRAGAGDSTSVTDGRETARRRAILHYGHVFYRLWGRKREMREHEQQQLSAKMKNEGVSGSWMSSKPCDGGSPGHWDWRSIRFPSKTGVQGQNAINEHPEPWKRTFMPGAPRLKNSVIVATLC